MINSDKEKDVFDLLQEKGYMYDIYHNGYVQSKEKLFISNHSVFTIPGDVKHYLQTGFIRNIRIFDYGFADANARSLGMRAHKDGRAVSIRRVK